MTEVTETKTTQSEQSAQNPAEQTGKTSHSEKTSQSERDQTILDELRISSQPITLENIKVTAVNRVKTRRSKSPDASKELSAVQAAVSEAVKNPDNFQADFVFRGETAPPQDTDLIRVLHTIAETTKKGQTVVNMKGKLEDWIYELEASTGDKTDTAKREIRKYKDKLFKKWTELVVEESEQQDKTPSSPRKASKLNKEKAAEFWRANVIVGENARLDQVERRIRTGSASLAGGQEGDTSSRAQTYVSLATLVPDVSALPEDVQKVVRGQDAVVRTSREGDLTAIDHEKGINTIAESELPDDMKDRLLKAAQANRRIAQEQVIDRQARREREPGFTTFNAQYLTPEEKRGIQQGGPDYWEELYNQTMFLLTADPNADVLRDQSSSSKISALQDYIASQGAQWFIVNEGMKPDKAVERARGWVREMQVETNEIIEGHNIFRAILGAPSVDDMVKVFQHVSVAQYDRLSGRSLVENPLKQRLVADANRIYEQAAVGHVTKKFRRHQHLEEKKKTTGLLTEGERKELENGYMLEFMDLIPQGSMWDNIRAKHHKHDVWVKVHSHLEEARRDNPQKTVDEVMDELAQNSKRDWKAIHEIMLSQPLTENQAKNLYVSEGHAEPVSFSEEDRKVFYALQQEMVQRGLSQEKASIDMAVAYTEDEKKLLKDIEAGQYYSPVEQVVFDELYGSEIVRLEQEKEQRRRQNQEVDRWYERELNKRKNYIRIAIVSARQHMYFSAHIQKINATVGTLPGWAPGKLQGLAFEPLLRAFNPEVTMHKRFFEYGQPVVREVGSLTYLMFFRHYFGDQLRLTNLEEWNKKLDNALKFTGDENFPKAPLDTPNARKGFDDIIKYLQEELGIPYSMLFTSQFLPSGGVYDPGGGWKDRLSHQEMAEQLLEATGRLGHIGDPNRSEYSLGLQFDIAGNLNDDEVARAASGFRTLQILMEDMKREYKLITSNRSSDSSAAKTAYEYVSSRLSDKKENITPEQSIKQIDDMDKLIKEHQDALTSGDQGRIAQTARAVQEKYGSKGFKKIQEELITERKKHVLRTMSKRMPTFVAQFFPADVDQMVKDKLSQESFEKREDVWEKLQHALFAVQNDLVRHEVVNKDIDKYFGRENAGFPTLDTYLRQFLGSDYHQYGNTCHEIAKELRSFFTDMEKGKVGRAQKLIHEGKINEADRKFIGMSQFEKVARFTRPATFLGDRQWENTQFGLAGGKAVINRRYGEIGEMAQVAGGLDGLITGMHHKEPQKIIEELKAIITTMSGVEDPNTAVMRGRSVMEAWIEMTKAPQLLEALPEAEGLLRMFMGHDNKNFREFARKRGSRIMQVTRDPNDPLFQKNELRQFVDLAWTIDAFLQKPEVFDEFYERFKIEHKDLHSYQFRRILPYIAFAIVALMVIQGWTVLQQGEEES
ncbi:hypothetical protein HY469_04850 [Candidatus Roizmanbacteria bacterium]|nr:hypothetical protein [Candidatus Roizmanbacteria bacterium]